MSSVVSYKYPPLLPSGAAGIRGNMEKWNTQLPLNGSIFRSDQSQSVILHIASNSEYIRTVQSFLTARCVPRSSNGTELVDAATRNTYQGVTRCFSRMVVRFGGTIIEDNSYYADTVGLHYSQLPNTRKEMLKRLEGFGNTSYFAGGGKKFAHPLFSSLFMSDSALPTPIIAAGGITVELFLAPAKEVFTTENVAYYTLENVQYKFLSVTPDPSFTIGLRSAVAQGRSCFLHFQRLHFFPSAGNGSNTQLIQVPINNVSSVAGIETVMWSDASYADQTQDKYLRFQSFGLQDFKIENSGSSQPSQLTFKYEGGADPEVTLLGLMSANGNVYNVGTDIGLESDWENTSFRIGMNFQSSTELAGTGYSLLGSSSPFMTITTTHNAPVPPTTRILTIATVDTLIEIRGSEISVSEII